MTLKLSVPTLVDAESAEMITEAIAMVDPTAQVAVDIATKTVEVDAQNSQVAVASEESIKQAITATGHAIEGY